MIATTYKKEFVSLQGVQFAISVNYNAEKHVMLAYTTFKDGSSGANTLIVSPEMAKELIKDFTKLNEWSRTDYYAWCKRKACNK